jgi:hypothetical protein
MKKFTILCLLCLSVLASGASATDETVVIPSVALSPGANGSFWKTAIGIYNASDSVRTVSARNILGAGEIPSAELQPGQFVGTDNLGAMFNAGEGTFLVQLTRSGPGVIFTARTYSVTESQPGQFGTLLIPVRPISEPISLVFTRAEGARKALFLYGNLKASCVTTLPDTVFVYFGTLGSLNRISIPEDALACKIESLGSAGYPSGGEASDYYYYAWASEGDNVSNCPTLITAE